MRIGYFGSPLVSAICLQRLLDASFQKEKDWELVFVLSNPDKRQGRSAKAQPTAVSSLVLEAKQGPALLRYENLHEREVLSTLASFAADIFVVFAYGKILPQEIYALPRLGAVNLHASLLPELRGASPIQSAILQGLPKTGWSIQYISKEVDSGDILAQEEVEIGQEETAGELTQRILGQGIALLLHTLREIQRADQEGGELKACLQKHEQASYCSKISKHSAKIDWRQSASSIARLVRAYNPSPVAWTFMDNRKLQIYRARIPCKDKEKQAFELWDQFAPLQPGSFMPVDSKERTKELWVKTGDGVLAIVELKAENRKKMRAHDFLNGCKRQEQIAKDKQQGIWGILAS